MARTEDLIRVRAVLETDREWAAFALADLAPEYSKNSEWHLADGTPAVVLVYRGFSPPILFALGTARNIAPLLGEVLGEREFYVAVLPEVFDLIRAAGYAMHDPKTMCRMVLDQDRFPRSESGHPERLGVCDLEQLLRLYRDGEGTGEAPFFFSESMLRNGVYFGIREAGVLVAAAGTHVFAPELSVAGIGNVYTRRDRRRCGFGLLATAAVTAELLQHRVRTIALNVAAENHVAIRVYERLGFARYCEYREARAVARNGRGGTPGPASSCLSHCRPRLY